MIELKGKTLQELEDLYDQQFLATFFI